MLILEYLINEFLPVITVIMLLIIYSFLYFIFKKKLIKISFILSTIVNVVLLPLSFFISILPTEDTDGRTFFTNLATFFYLQGVPLVWFVVSFFIYKRYSSKSKLTRGVRFE